MATFRLEASAGLFVGVRQFVDGEREPDGSVALVEYAVDDAVDLAQLFVSGSG